MLNSYEKRLMRVLEYIHANPAGDLSLDTLADVAKRCGYPAAQSFTRLVFPNRMELRSAALYTSPHKGLRRPSAKVSMTRRRG